MKRITIALIAAAAFASPAFAAASTFDVEISIDRTQIQTEEGAQAAYSEIKANISAECAEQNVDTRFLAKRLTDICTKRTLENAVTSIDEPRLTAVHKAATGKSS